MITSFGDSGLPVFQAGHWLWHRPHSVQVAKSSIALHLKSSTLPTPKMSSSPGSSKSTGLPFDNMGSSGPRPSGSRLVATLSGARKMCRCLEYTTSTRKPRMTPIWARMKTVSMTSLAVLPSGSSAFASHSEANAPLSYGKYPVFTCAARYRSSVTMTAVIMPRITQAGPVCEP
jgi:hypothetical protein